MRRYELDDRQWAAIADLIPPPAPRGRPRSAPRRMLNGMFWILRSGSSWRDLPERYGPWQTVYHWFNRWRKQGLFDQMLQRLQIRLDRDGWIDWDLWCVDGSSVRATQAAAGGGKRGDRTNPPTTHWAARAADSGASSTWSLTVGVCPSRSP